MRHFVATQAGLSDLSNAELQVVHKHMGHSKTVYETIYRCPESSKSILIANKIAASIYQKRDSGASTSGEKVDSLPLEDIARNNDIDLSANDDDASDNFELRSSRNSQSI